MKRIKKYKPPKEEKPREPQPVTVRLRSRFEIGIRNLFAVSPNLKEVEADLQTPCKDYTYIFHLRHLKLLYEKYREGEIDTRYLKKWFRIFIMASKNIATFRTLSHSETMSKLVKLAANNQLTRKNFLELNQALFHRLAMEPTVYIDITTGQVVEVKHEQPAKVLPLVPDSKVRRKGKRT